MAKIEKSRIFLCVVDDSDELESALHYAARRAKFTNGHVALFYCIEREHPTLQHWSANIRRIMKQETKVDAESYMDRAANHVKSISGEDCIQYIKEGPVVDALLSLLKDTSLGISTLVLAAGSSKKGPGPLITHFVSKQAYQMPVPITIVPHHLSKEEIDHLTGP